MVDKYFQNNTSFSKFDCFKFQIFISSEGMSLSLSGILHPMQKIRAILPINF